MRSLLIMLLLATSAMANPPPKPTDPPATDGVYVPVGPIPILPIAPTPPPVVGPIKLPPDVYFIITATKPLMVLSSPAGIVNVVPEKGPLQIRGKFIESPEKVQTKTFTRDYIYSVEPIKANSGQCELLIFEIGEVDAAKVQRRVIDTAMLPIPPPGPVDPDPVDPPAPVGELRVLFLYERDNLKASQANVMNSQTVVNYLKAKCAKNPTNGSPDYRYFDQNADMSKETPTIAGMYTSGKAASKTLPSVVIYNGDKGISYPFEKWSTVPALMALLQKAGG